MNVVDSCGWLEYFADGSNADFFAPAIEDTEHLIVPVVCLFEVFKRILQQCDETDAIRAIALMQQGQIIDLDSNLALKAAQLGVQYKIPMADSMILSTAYQYSATVWTQDNDFEGLAEVKFIKKG